MNGVVQNRKTVLILGASSDLGVELIRKLNGQEDSCTVLAHYSRNRKALEELEQECSSITLQLFQADLERPESVKRMLEEIQKSVAVPTHIISFAAAQYQYMRLSEWNEEAVKRDMEIQVYALAAVFRAFLPRMAKMRYGKIVLMLSSCTLGVPPKFLANYTTVKYALLGLMRSAAAEYGDQGININGVSPAMIETKFIKGVGRKIRELNAEENPRGRNLTVEDVIPAVLYLMSDESEFVNGTNLNLSAHCE